MEHAILVTASFAVGAGIGAVLADARARKLLQYYGDLVVDLSRMLHGRSPQAPEPTRRAS